MRMTEKIEQVLSEFPEIIGDAQALTFLTRKTELQEVSVAELSDYIDQLNSAQRIAINDRDEDCSTDNVILTSPSSNGLVESRSLCRH